MTRWIAVSLVLAGLAFNAARVAAAAAPPVPEPTGRCSADVAVQVAGHNNPFFSDVADHPIEQTLCGAFAGPGSNTMAVTYSAPTCWGPRGWTVYRYVNGQWEMIADHPGVFIVGKLVDAGGDIRESEPVFEKSDSRCGPSGGTRTRTWHWNGTRFVAGHATITRPKVVSRESFQTPSHNIFCSIGASDKMYCVSKKAPRNVSMDYKGDITICNGRKCLGFGSTSGLPVLQYGQRDEYAGYVCRSQTSGVTCTPKGRSRGFRISSAAVKRVG